MTISVGSSRSHLSFEREIAGILETSPMPLGVGEILSYETISGHQDIAATSTPLLKGDAMAELYFLRELENRRWCYGICDSNGLIREYSSRSFYNEADARQGAEHAIAKPKKL